MIKMFCKQPVHPGDVVTLRNEDVQWESAMNVVASTSLAVVLAPSGPDSSPFAQHKNTVYRLMGRYRDTKPKDVTHHPHWREVRWMVAW